MTEPASFAGIWRSVYTYESSSRHETFHDSHYLIISHSGTRLQARSIPESNSSSLSIALTVEGRAITGTWREITDPSGYYRGITFHGAVQFLPDALLRERLTGQWVGFSRKGDKVNTGLWILEIVSRDTSPDAIAAFSKPA